MPKGRNAQEKQWACGDCQHNKTTFELDGEESVNEAMVRVFECLHSDPQVRMAASKDVLATCDSWDEIADSS